MAWSAIRIVLRLWLTLQSSLVWFGFSFTHERKGFCMVTITIPSGHKVGSCAGDNGRFALGNVLAFSANDQTYLAATDCKVLAVVPVDSDQPIEPVLLPAKACNSNGSPKSITVNGEVRTMDKKKTEVFPLPEQEGRFPGFGSIFPNASEMVGYTALTLDAKLLADLVSAISPEGRVTLLVPPNGKLEQVSKPVVAIGLEECSARGFGLIMPIEHQITTLHANRARVASMIEHMPEQGIGFTPAPAPLAATA